MDDDFKGNDPLQPKDDYFNPDVDEVKLSEDNDPPFTPADDVAAPKIQPDYPTTDDGIEDDEAYDEGVAHASGFGEQQVDVDTQAKPVELDHQDPEK